jgi:dethiobiotin synthetase
MAAFFVTGAGTDIGKTWISARLLRFWRWQGLKPSAIKPAASGFDARNPLASDAAELLKALALPTDLKAVEAMSPFRLRAPLSLDQAAAREGQRLSVWGLSTACAAVVAAAQGPVLIEGAGGVMSPVNEDETMLDLALALGKPCIFVCGSYLGAISHALTGLAVLRAKGAAVALVLVNETPGSPVTLLDTVVTLTAHVRGAPVLAVERDCDEAVWAEASHILGVSIDA